MRAYRGYRGHMGHRRGDHAIPSRKEGELMDFYKDKRFLLTLLAFIAFAVGIVVIGGWLLIVALLFFGFTTFIWKESHIKLSGMAFLVLLALLNILVNGMNFGIDFVGGTRIPVFLDHPVDQTTMAELVQTIK